MPYDRKVTREQVERARRLRRESSAAERVFWKMARGRKLGFEFRRQHPLEQFTLDFFCREALLDIEFDGEQHDAERDRARDAVLLERWGIETIRIPNREFFRLDREEPWRDWIAAIIAKCEERSGRKAFTKSVVGDDATSED